MKNKKMLNTKIGLMLALIVIVLAAGTGGCSNNTETVERQDSESLTVERGGHERDGGEHGGKGAEGSEGNKGDESGGEESGTDLALDAIYDVVRNGARLILTYDAQSNSFIGTVENTTVNTMKQVQVEVHLSNGIELGPTIPVDLAPGEKVVVKLPATSQAFDGWIAHPEIGSGEGGSEHGGGGEGGSEHGGGGEGGGEHGGGGD